jgi:hypothetical protein
MWEGVARMSGTNTPQIMDDFAKDFLKEEQKQRRTELETQIARIEGDQRYGLVITGLIWSWLVTNREKVQPPVDRIAVAVPALIMMFFFLRWTAIEASIANIAEYTRKLEANAGLLSGLGWESFMTNKRATTRKKDKLTTSTTQYWTLLIGTNVLLGVLFIWFLHG